MANLSELNVAQLKRAVAIKEQIEALENELNSLATGIAPAVSYTAPAPAKRGPGRPPGSGRTRISAAGRAAIAAAQKARWAKLKANSPGMTKPAGKRKMSAAGRRAIAAAARARWAKAKAAGRSRL